MLPIRSFRHAVSALLALLIAFSAWGAESPAAQAPLRHYHPLVAPSFDCNEAGAPVQDFICASNVLSALDRDAAELFHAQLRLADLFGRDQLLAEQRRWLSSRAARCTVPATRQAEDVPDVHITACIEKDIRDRIANLRVWQPQTRTMKLDSDHPMSAYMQFSEAQFLDTSSCERFRGLMNSAIKYEGNIDVARISGVKLIAASNGQSETQQPVTVAIVRHDAGAYGSYELRAIGLKLAGNLAIDTFGLGQWISEQPNHGGRPSDLSSQTNDYDGIDVFSLDGSEFALVRESWGYYTPAASGESAYAGLYSLDSGHAQRRCLFRTYLRPSNSSGFAELPAYTALLESLEAIRSTEPSGLDLSDRRDEELLRQEQKWQLLHLPLIQSGQARQFGWTGWLRYRHDINLDRLFAWSEGALTAKQLYRVLLPTVKPAMAEVGQTMQQTQGITAEEAKEATELLFMELLEYAIGPVVNNGEAYAQQPSVLSKYKPRFPVMPERADLEKGRPIATLYSTILNRLPAKAVGDFIEYEASHPEKRSFGRHGETPLMASVLTTDRVVQLLMAGADPNGADRYGFTPLISAVRNGQYDSAVRLIDAGARVEAQTLDQPTNPNESDDVLRAHSGGKTALHFAAAYGDSASVQLLLERGAGIGQRDHYGANPCDVLRLRTRVSNVEREALTRMLCSPLGR